MKGYEQFVFEVNAKTEEASRKLRDIYKLMNQIEGIRNKGESDYSTTSQKDMDKSMRNIAKISQEVARLKKELPEMVQAMQSLGDVSLDTNMPKEMTASIGAMRTAMQQYAREIPKAEREMSQMYAKALRAHNQLVTFQQNYSKNFKHIFSSNDVFNLPREYKEVQRQVKSTGPDGKERVETVTEKVLDTDRARKIVDAMTDDLDGTANSIKEVKDRIQEANKLDRRNESLSRRARASNYMSYQQASSFSDDYHRTQTDYVSAREENKQEMTSLGLERTRLFNEIKRIESEGLVEEIDKKIAMQQTIQAIDEEMAARAELNRTLARTIRNMEEYNNKVLEGKDGKGVEVKPERGTFKGMMYERAPAIGLALGGAVGLAFGGLYQKGSSINQSMRDDVISIGQRTRQNDWRTNVRDQAFDSGMEDYLGFTGQEMLNFQNAYLSNRGLQNLDDLHTAASSQAEFSRVTGLSSETTADFFDNLYDSAALTGESAKDIQNAFLGAIKQSGMEGREEEQLSALNTLVDSVSQGGTVRKEDVLNLMGLQSLFNQSGQESLRGDRGARLLADMDSGIRQGIDNPKLRLMYGMGTKYQGPEGYAELARVMEQGISNIENVEVAFRVAESSYTGPGEISDDILAGNLHRLFRQEYGVEVNMEQIDALVDLYRRGELNQEALDSIIKEDLSVGEVDSAERLKMYQDSSEALANQSEAITDKQAANLNDFGDLVKKANNAIGWLPAPVYASVVALGALAAAAASTAASFGLSRGVRKWAGSKYGKSGGGRGRRGGKGGRRPNIGSGNGPTPPFGGGGLGGMFFGGSFGGKDGTLRKGIGNIFTKGKDITGKAMEGIGGFFKGKGGGSGILPQGAGGLGKIVGKSFLPFSILSGVGSVAAAPEGEKGRAIGESAGGILGGIGGGAALGAAGGSIFPGVGTVIGGVLGSIVGGIGGSKLGGWIGEKASGVGNWFKGLFSGDKDKESKNSKNKDDSVDVKDQVDRENTTKQARTEEKRGDNISEESFNLDRQENIIQEAKKVLHQARLQNGILGSMAGGYGMSESAQILSGNSNAEKAWNFFAGKGLSPQAISGILGNLQQESGLDPTATNASSGAFGIGQWLGVRKTNLFNYSQSKGLDPNSLEAQLEFMWKELEEGKDSRLDLNSFKNITDVKQAADIFERDFERSGGSAMDKRRNYAQEFYKQYGTVKVDSNINVTVKGDQSVSQQVSNSKELERTAMRIQDKIYGSMNFHAKEMRRA